jgi:hypothetical protein
VRRSSEGFTRTSWNNKIRLVRVLPSSADTQRKTSFHGSSRPKTCVLYIYSVNLNTSLIKYKLKEARVPLEKLILSELAKEFLASFLTSAFITAFTTACYLTLFYPDRSSSKPDTVFLSGQIECRWIFKWIVHVPEKHGKRLQWTLWWNITTLRLGGTDYPEWRFTWFSSIQPGACQYNV